jgi:enolase-phosphatase E1
MIWKDGYANGEYTAHVYSEVPARLRRWKDEGKTLYVYSSGSVPAQKLLFGHTDAGDLTPLFSGYFDTETGGKREAASYRRIAQAIGIAPESIMFLSDIVEELDAARAAGMRTIQLARAPTHCPVDGAHPCVADFDMIDVH